MTDIFNAFKSGKCGWLCKGCNRDKGDKAMKRYRRGKNRCPKCGLKLSAHKPNEIMSGEIGSWGGVRIITEKEGA